MTALPDGTPPRDLAVLSFLSYHLSSVEMVDHIAGQRARHQAHIAVSRRGDAFVVRVEIQHIETEMRAPLIKVPVLHRCQVQEKAILQIALQARALDIGDPVFMYIEIEQRTNRQVFKMVIPERSDCRAVRRRHRLRKIDADSLAVIRVYRLHIVVRLAVQRRPLQEQDLGAVRQQSNASIRHLCDIPNPGPNLHWLNKHHVPLIHAHAIQCPRNHRRNQKIALPQREMNTVAYHQIRNPNRRYPGIDRFLIAIVPALGFIVRPYLAPVLGAVRDVRPAIVHPRSQQIEFIAPFGSMFSLPDVARAISDQALRISEAACDNVHLSARQIDAQEAAQMGIRLDLRPRRQRIRLLVPLIHGLVPGNQQEMPRPVHQHPSARLDPASMREIEDVRLDTRIRDELSLPRRRDPRARAFDMRRS